MAESMMIPSHLITDYYVVLEIDRSAHTSEIVAKYLKLAQERSLDGHAFNAKATDDWLLLHEAYSCLRDPEQRTVYDEWEAVKFVHLAQLEQKRAQYLEIELELASARIKIPSLQNNISKLQTILHDEDAMNTGYTAWLETVDRKEPERGITRQKENREYLLKVIQGKTSQLHELESIAKDCQQRYETTKLEISTAQEEWRCNLHWRAWKELRGTFGGRS